MESMLCPVLVGRSAEMRALTDDLDAAGRSDGRAVLLTGDAGVGKSRLVREVIADAAARGYLILTGRATESAVPVPFRPISEALMGAARSGIVPDARSTSDYRAALGTLVPEWSHPGDGDAEVSAVIIGEALLRLLSLPGWPAGLLVLEDLHWADPETLAIVEYLADNVADSRILVLATLRDTEPSAGLKLLRSLTARRAAARVHVRRLAPRAVTQMAAACLNVTDVPRAVSRLLADCDGLPFAVEEILAAAVSSGELVRGTAGWQVNNDVVTGVPSSIVGSVRNRIAGLGQQARNVIVSAAVLGRQFDWALLPSVADVGESEALEALHEAHDVQLIEPVFADGGAFRFRHSLTRAAIVSDLLPPELASRSARAAEAIEAAHPGLPGVWCELVAELRAASGQPVGAARLLLTAGRRALRQGALASAIAVLRDAHKLLADAGNADLALDLQVEEVLAEALALSGDYQQLSLLAEGLIARLNAIDPDPRRRQALIRIRAASARPEDNADAAAAHLSAASELAHGLDDLELASRIDAVGARYALAGGELDQAAQLAHRSLASAESAGLSGWAAEVAVESLDVIGRRERMRDLGAARAAFERAHKLADKQALGVWRIRMLHELATLDMLTDGATSALMEVSDLAHEAGVLSIASVIDLQLANLWSLGTDLDRALVTAQRCERGAAQLGSRRMEVMAICLQALVAAIQGDCRGAESQAERAEAIMPGDPEVLATTIGQIRVLAALFRDDVDRAVSYSTAARAYLDKALGAPGRGRGFYSPSQAPVIARGRSYGLHALLQAASDGDISGAVALAANAGAAVSWNRGCLAYAEAVLAGKSGTTERATALADEGYAWFAPFAPWWNRLARRLVGPAALRDGWGEPVAWLREAAAGFEATGHDRLAAACRGLLRKAGERVPRSGRGQAQVPPQMRRLGVTSREMDVYLLVAQGYSNAEIAARLFISPKTVETHVANLVAKTGRAGRRELVAHAARFAGSWSPDARTGLTQVLECVSSGCA
jgi:DNA-binding CsgD family transcriptional regulator